MVDERELRHENSIEIEQISTGWRKLHEILSMCDRGWMLELYGRNFKPHMHVVLESIDDAKEHKLNYDDMIFFDGFDPEDKIIFAYNECPDEFNRLLKIK